MGVRPLTLPLEGGSEGAEVRVHPLDTASGPAPPAYFKRPDGPAKLLRAVAGTIATPRSKWPPPMPIPAFLVEHPTAGPFMVDAGVSPVVAERGPTADLGPVGGRILSVRMRPEQAAGAQVLALGFDPEAVRLVVMTHLHFDHIGGGAQFPNASFVVSRPEWDDTPSAVNGKRQHHRDQVADWQAYPWPSEPWEQFSRTADLFGDGSVRLVATPGHTPGHVSLVLRLAGGRTALLVADAAYARRSLDGRDVPLICPDVETYLASLDELRAFVAAHPDALVVCGHDPWEWPTVSRELAG